MRISYIIILVSAIVLSGCGWKMATTPLRIQGQVLDADTGAPIEGAYIDISDQRDELDFAIKTDALTTEDGKFDTTYQYCFEKWMWLGFPVFWIPDKPEKIYIEAVKSGYRQRIIEVDGRGLKKGTGDTGPPNVVEPLHIHSIKKR